MIDTRRPRSFIPKIHGGSDDVENLALACIDCNLHKGTNLTGIDPETSVITELFHIHGGMRGVTIFTGKGST